MGKSVQHVKNIRWSKQHLYVVSSLDFPTFNDEEECLIDIIADKNPSFESKVIDNIILQDFIKDYISKLPDKNKSVLLERLKFKTLEEIAQCVNTQTTKITELKRDITREAMRIRELAGLKKLEELRNLNK